MNGRKHYFKQEQLRRVKVPRYKQLTYTKVMEYCNERPSILRYLPNQRLDGEPTCDREFLLTILNTLDPEYFPNQLRAVEEEKKQKMESQSEDVIEVKPEILELINAFDFPMQKSTKGSARALGLLKMGAKKGRPQGPPACSSQAPTGPLWALRPRGRSPTKSRCDPHGHIFVNCSAQFRWCFLHILTYFN